MAGRLSLAIAISFGWAWQSVAGGADVTKVEVSQTGQGIYRFDVTVRHGDDGWQHYADRWEIVGPDGTVLAVRKLAHPHVDEQPFTRSLDGVDIAPVIEAVVVRARDKVHGYDGREVTVRLCDARGSC